MISNNHFLYKYGLKFKCDDKAEFPALLLNASVSHDLSEVILRCWFAAQETFWIIINVKNSCAAKYFCGNWSTK